MKARKSQRPTPQIKITVPPALWPDIRTAMAYDGATKASAFALAAVMQRVRRLKEQAEAEKKQ